MSRQNSKSNLGFEARNPNGAPPSPERKKIVMSTFLSKSFGLTELENTQSGYEPRRNANYPFNPVTATNSNHTKTSLPRRSDVPEIERFSTSKYSWPIFLVIFPPIISIFYGDAQTWSDLLLLVLVGFYLYLVIKVPWELYFVARKKTMNMVSLAGTFIEPGDAAQEVIRFEAEKKLRRQERLAFVLVIISPMLGGYLLHISKNYLSQFDDYFSQLNIMIFIFAAGVKPTMYLASLLKKRALMLQEEIHYPVGEVEGLRRRVGFLENELNQLTKAYATKRDIGQVRDGVEPALIQFSGLLQKYDRREQRIRAKNEERLSRLEKKLNEFECEDVPSANPKSQLLEFFMTSLSRFVYLPESLADNSRKLVKYFLPNSLDPVSSGKTTPLIQNSDRY
ncbi:hypothetical protein K7432_002961 [Basidiobolus ranarum]|uniref:Uncharacterized protein n=1 Tax=Basidiobolus ranarum TaxID=34480 RepID=A0ABR2W6W5_9FUNG